MPVPRRGRRRQREGRRRKEEGGGGEEEEEEEFEEISGERMGESEPSSLDLMAQKFELELPQITQVKNRHSYVNVLSRHVGSIW